MNKRSLAAIFLSLLFCTQQASAQYATAMAYPFAASPKTFTYLTGSTVVPTLSDDDITVSGIALGFTFKFAGATYTTVSVGSNGFISLSSTTLAPYNSGALGSVAPVLMPLMANLQGNAVPTGGVASYLTTGTAPNRVFTFEWKNWGWFSTNTSSVSNVHSMQAKLYENGNVEYLYQREANTPPSSALGAIGIGKSITDYQLLSSTGASPTVVTTSFSPTLTTVPASGQSYLWGCNINITSMPLPVAVCAGGNASFTAAASGTGITYQWQVDPNTGTFANITNGGVYAGATTGTLVITGVTAGMNNYKYSCVISNGTCTIPTDGALLSTGTTATSITTQPVAKTTVCENSNTSVSVVAAGAGLSYQWQVDPNTGTFANITNNTVYSNATTSALTITATPLINNNFKYRCIVTGVCPSVASVTSNPDTLTVNAQAVINAQPATRTSVCTNNAGAVTVTATGATTYQWQQDPATGTYANLAATAILTNVTTNSLTITNPTTTLNNYKFRVVINNAANCPITSAPDTLTVLTTVAVTTNPVVKTITCSGVDASITAAGTGSNLAYQWQVDPLIGSFTNLTNGGPYNGVNTATLTFVAPTVALNGFRYRCVLSGTCTPGVNTTVDTLFINSAPAITTNPSNITVCSGTNAIFVAKATGTQLTYQWQEQVPGGSFANLVSNANYKNVTGDTLTVASPTSAKNNNQYRCIVTGICSPFATSNVGTLTVNENTQILTLPVSATTCDSVNISLPVTAMGVGLTYQWQLNPGTVFNNIINNATYSGANTPTLSITNPNGGFSGNQYRVLVNGGCGALVTSNTILFTVNSFPKVTAQPQDDTVNVGDPATFTIAAVGSSVTYQWQANELDNLGYKDLFNNSSYTGAFSTTLTVNGTYLTKNGYLYRCIAKGLCTKDDTSTAAKLGVGLPTGINNVAAHRSGITLYPNPVMGSEMIMNIDAPASKDMHFKITDQLGRLVITENIHLSQDNTATINVSRLQPGVYILQVNDMHNAALKSISFTKQ